MRVASSIFAIAFLVACTEEKRAPDVPVQDSLVIDTPAVDTPAVDTGTVLLLEQEDTVGVIPEISAEDTLIALGERPRQAAPRSLFFGFFSYPTDKWGQNNFTGATFGSTPQYLGGALRAADRASIAVIVSFPRRLMKEGLQDDNKFSLTNAKKLVDDYLRYFPRDSMQKYVSRGTLKGFMTGDDFGCLPCNGGVKITQQQQAQLTIYAKQRFGAEVPLGVRTNMKWISAYNGWQKSLDFGWAQYRADFGPAASYFEENNRLAKAAGMKMVGGLNSHKCWKLRDGVFRRCTATEIRTAMPYPIKTYPSVFCAINSWKWDTGDWNVTTFREAIQAMALLAKQQQPRSCRRAT